jgi:hypothetical protein
MQTAIHPKGPQKDPKAAKNRIRYPGPEDPALISPYKGVFIFLHISAYSSKVYDFGPMESLFEQKRNSEKANPPKADKYRMSNNEYRMSK